MTEPDRAAARQLAATHIAAGGPLGWFEELYTRASAGDLVVPWADLAPNRNLLDWLDRQPAPPTGARAIVIGCGLGDDAEELARRGWNVTAFDISETAIAWCTKRFPCSTVAYLRANLFSLPESWKAAYDLVVEIFTLQALPTNLRTQAVGAVASLSRPGGRILVIAPGRDVTDPEGQMPWPLTRHDLATFSQVGLDELSFEDYLDGEAPPVRRFRATYSRPDHL